MNRRKFLGNASACGAHVLGLAAFSPLLSRQVFAAQDDKKIITTEKWGRIEKVHQGIWALISTPFDNQDFKTVCNGGIIQGTKQTMVVEASMQDSGAAWLAEHATTLTGRRPTDVVCTHYHADHCAGHAGFITDNSAPRFWLTDNTHKSAVKSLKERNLNHEFKNVQKLDMSQPTEIDLGGRVVKVIPRMGHTNSDVTVEVVDPKVVFCGDLFFNRMYPNYADATPSKLNEYAKQLIAAKDSTFIPGHGPIADATAISKYKDFLEFVQTAATKSFKAGDTAEQGAKSFKLPEAFSSWFVWSPEVIQRSFIAWYKELDTASKNTSK